MVFPKKCTRLTVYPQWKPVYLSAARWWRMKWQCIVVGAGPIKFLMIAFDCWLLVALLWLNDCMAAYIYLYGSIYALLRCSTFFYEQIKPSRGSRHYVSRHMHASFNCEAIGDAKAKFKPNLAEIILLISNFVLLFLKCYRIYKMTF